MVDWIWRLCSIVFECGVVPEHWRSTVILFHCTRDKGEWTECKNYKSISLSMLEKYIQGS